MSLIAQRLGLALFGSVPGDVDQPQLVGHPKAAPNSTRRTHAVVVTHRVSFASWQREGAGWMPRLPSEDDCVQPNPHQRHLHRRARQQRPHHDGRRDPGGPGRDVEALSSESTARSTPSALREGIHLVHGCVNDPLRPRNAAACGGRSPRRSDSSVPHVSLRSSSPSLDGPFVPRLPWQLLPQLAPHECFPRLADRRGLPGLI